MQNKNRGYRVVTSIAQKYSGSQTNDIRSADKQDSGKCNCCEGTLQKSMLLIPVSKSKYAEVPGMYCQKCNCFYADNILKIKHILSGNAYAERFTVNGIHYYDIAEALKQEKEMHRQMKMDNIESAVVLIEVDKKSDYIIVNKKQNSDWTNHVISYREILARELLAAAFVESKSGLISAGLCSGNAVTDYVLSSRYGGCPLITKRIELKKGGGYMHHAKKAGDEIVDILLFSPRTQRYEIAHATYNKQSHRCYMDSGIYRNFVRKYGNPGVFLYTEKSGYGVRDWSELNESSFLAEYGYSVKQDSGLSESERHNILSEIVDLKLMDVSDIVNHIDFCIMTHSESRYLLARTKWENDKKFISGYRVNTERFLIYH